MITENLTFNTADRRFDAVLFRPDDPRRRPGVLVLHGGAGLDAHALARARRLAEAGFVALAADLFGGPFRDRAHGMAVIGGLVQAPGDLRARSEAALALLASQPDVDAQRLAAIGFCFGGLAALEAARAGLNLRCVASFHGGVQPLVPGETKQIETRLLFCIGAADPFCKAEARQALEAELAQREAVWQINVYGGAQHGFTEQPAAGSPDRPGVAYHASADQRSWRDMLAMFDEELIGG